MRGSTADTVHSSVFGGFGWYFTHFMTSHVNLAISTAVVTSTSVVLEWLRFPGEHNGNYGYDQKKKEE